MKKISDEIIVLEEGVHESAFACCVSLSVVKVR